MTTVVMTGGTSGLGLWAANRLRANGARLILGARRPAGPDLLPLDLESLDSVREFAAAATDLAGGRIDALVCNAGMVRRDADGRTVDGLETTFAVNHLAHHLLVRLLLPHLAPDARIVLTTSGTHDPDTHAELVPPRHADVDLLAHPERDPDLDGRPTKAGQHAYTASKLCVVVTARTLAARPDIADRTVVALCPGQVFGTGLAADLPWYRRAAWRVMGTPVSRPLRRVVPTLNSAEQAGRALADLASGSLRPPPGRSYAALRRGQVTWPEPTLLARDAAVADAVWQGSVRLARLEAPPSHLDERRQESDHD